MGPAPLSPSAVGMQSLQAPWLSTRPSGQQAATSLSGQVVGFPPDLQGSKQLPVFLARLLAFHHPLRAASSHQSFWPGCGFPPASHSGQQAATSLQSGQAVGFPPAPQGSKQLPVFLARLLAFHQPLRAASSHQSFWPGCGQAVGFPPAPQTKRYQPVFWQPG